MIEKVDINRLDGASVLLNIMLCTDGKISVRINLPLFSTVVPSNIKYLVSSITRWDDGGK